MAIVDKLRQILGYKNDIKEAIENKGLTVTDDMSSYSTAIDDIPDIKQYLRKDLEIVKSDEVLTGNYQSAFAGQIKLKEAYLEIGDNANCQNMFEGCKALTKTPIFSATKMLDYCYQSMFENCTGLTKAPDLPATSVPNNGYQQMFAFCTSLTTAPELPATTVLQTAYRYMFRRCPIIKAPDLPATTTSYYAYEWMFTECTALEKTGVIAVEGVLTYRAAHMFEGCTALKETTWTATTPPTQGTDMFKYCPSDMIIYVPDEAVEAYKGASGWISRAAYIKPISEKPTA